MAGNVNNAKEQVARNVAERKQSMRKEEADTKERLKQSIKDGRSRPMLSEGTSGGSKNGNLAKLIATKKVLEAYQESGLTKEYAMRTLTEEQKELLNEENFLRQ